MQVSYRNESTTRGYKPGELEIRVPNLSRNDTNSTHNTITNVRSTIKTSGQDSQEEWWELASPRPMDTSTEDFVFRNKKEIPVATSFQGTLQVVYSLTPVVENEEYLYQNELHEDKCEHKDTQKISATLNNNITSNEITYNYRREYIHPWQAEQLGANFSVTEMSTGFLDKEALTMIPDGKNAEDYYWAIASVGYPRQNSKYPNGRVDTVDLEINGIPNDVIIFDVKNNKIQNGGKYTDTYSADENTFKITNGKHPDYGNYLILAYPKESYKNTTQILRRTGVVHYEYKNIDANVYLSNAIINFNEYSAYSPSNELSEFSVRDDIESTKLYYEDMLRGETASVNSKMTTSNRIFRRYEGESYNLVYDYNYQALRDSNSSVFRKLDEGEFYITDISMPEKLYQIAHNETLNTDTVNVKLYTKKSNEEYTLNKTFVYSEGAITGERKITFTENDNVVAYRLVFENLNKNFDLRDASYQDGKNTIATTVNYSLDPTKQTTNEGEISVIPSIRVQKNGTFVSLGQNQDLPADPELITNDQDQYGDTILRAYVKKQYQHINWNNASINFYGQRQPSNYGYNQNTEMINGKTTDYISFGTQSNITKSKILNIATEEDFITEFELMDVAERKVHIVSSEQEIKDSIQFLPYNENINVFSYENGKVVEKTKEELVEILKQSTIDVNFRTDILDDNEETVVITIKPKNPILIYSDSSYMQLIRFSYDWRIPGVDHAKYGPMYYGKFVTQLKHSGPKKHVDYSGTTLFMNSDPVKGILKADYNKDGHVDIEKTSNANWDRVRARAAYSNENYSYYVSTSSLNIVAPITTYQGLLTLAKGEKDIDFSISPAEVGTGKFYQYRNRVQTGDSPVTDLIVYSNLEEAYSDEAHWQGQFVLVDTSYIQGVTDVNGNHVVAKVYYSENSDAKKMPNDTSWKLLTTFTDRTKVKSIAVEYVDQDGNPAILPKNTYIHYDIVMKSPDEMNYGMAYMSSFTSWSALDTSYNKVESIDGVKSNVVNAYMSKQVPIIFDQKWDDNDDEYGLRPSTLNYRLVKNNGVVVKTIPLNIKNNEEESSFDAIDYFDYKNYHVEIVNDNEFNKYYENTLTISEDKAHYSFNAKLKDDAIKTIRIRNIDEQNRLVKSKFELKDAVTNEVVKEWTQSEDKNNEYIEIKLPIDKNYVLTQKSTPNKYYVVNGANTIRATSSNSIQSTSNGCTNQQYCFSTNTSINGLDVTIISHTIMRNVTLDYIDSETNQKIDGIASESKDYEYGSEYSYTAKEIEHYTLDDCNSGNAISGTVIDKNVHIICKYTHKRGDISIIYIDKETGNQIEAEGLQNPNTSKDILTGQKIEVSPIDIVDYTQDKSNEKQTVTVAEGVTTVKFYYIHEKGEVTVRYIDDETNETIHEQVHEENILTQTEYKATAPTIEHYQLIGENEKKVKISTTPSVIEFRYSRNKGLVVTRYFDTDTKTEFENSRESVTKRVGEEVEVFEKEFEGYVLIVKPSVKKYEVTEETQYANYYYRRNSSVDSSINKDSISIDGEETVITDKEQPVNYVIKYNSTILDYVGPVDIKVIDTLPYDIDTEKSDLDGGTYDEDSRTITWTKHIDKIEALDEELTITSEYNFSVVYSNLDLKQRTVTNQASGETILDNNKHGAQTTQEIRLEVPGKIIIHFVDGDKNEIIEPIEVSGLIGEFYTPAQAIIPSYNLINEPESTEYEFEENDQDIFYVYERIPNPKTYDNLIELFAIMIASVLGLLIALKISRKRKA